MTSFLPLLGVLLLLSSICDACRSGHKVDRGTQSTSAGQEKHLEQIKSKGQSANRGGVSGCSLRINSDLGKESALLLKPSGSLDGHRFMLPTAESDILTFKHAEKILLTCPGNGNSIVINNRQKQYSEVIATCQSGSKFLVEGVATDFRYVKCKSTPDPSVQRVGQCHRNQHELHAIGFQVSAGFIRLMETCYDARLYNTLYVRFNLMKGAENRQRNVPRLSYFRKSTHFRNIQPPIEKVYNCVKGQYAVFLNLLGSPQLAARYINCNSRTAVRLEKGHLAAYADFIYHPQQKATLYYINTAPQWESFNLGNWKILEERVRKYARIHNTDLVVYAGSYNVSRLRDVNENECEIFLTKDSNNNPVLPVPQSLYRMVLDQTAKRGIVFLGVNSIRRDDRHVICPDVCEQTISFFGGWNRIDVVKGVIYCCTVKDFLSATGLTSTLPGSGSALLK